MGTGVFGRLDRITVGLGRGPLKHLRLERSRFPICFETSAGPVTNVIAELQAFEYVARWRWRGIAVQSSWMVTSLDCDTANIVRGDCAPTHLPLRPTSNRLQRQFIATGSSECGRSLSTPQ